jgi:NADH-quinone oxidoreductase subunit N
MSLTFAISPLLILAVGAMALMLAEAFAKRSNGLALGTTIVFAAAGAFAMAVWLYGLDDIEGLATLSPWLIIDHFTLFFDVLLCLGGALAALLAGGYLPEHNLDRGEFYSLLLFATFGAMMLAAAGDVLTLFLGLETMSIGAYALTAFRRASAKSAEGALKYFLLGSFAAALLLFGFTLIYGATGHTDLVGIGAALKAGATKNPMVVVGLVLVLAGLVFKVSAVPFHMWTPDAYEGAPSAVTGFMSTGVKAAAFAAFARVFLSALEPLRGQWSGALQVIAIATMVVGAVVGVAQSNVKRMLAYSSIAHGGYLLVGLVAANEVGKAAILFYLAAYAITNLAAFGVIALLGARDRANDELRDYAGLWYTHPGLSALMTVCLLSLGGRIYARFERDPEPLGTQWYRSVRRVLLKRVAIEKPDDGPVPRVEPRWLKSANMHPITYALWISRESAGGPSL